LLSGIGPRSGKEEITILDGTGFGIGISRAGWSGDELRLGCINAE